MTMQQKLRVSRWDRHKLCPKHGMQYLLIREFDHPSQTGMCAHPECVEKIISAMSNHRNCGGLIKFCRKLDRDRGENEFGTYVIISLLEGAKRGKPTVLNSFHMRWTCLNYLTKLRQQEKKDEAHKQIMQQIADILTEETAELVYNLGMGAFVSHTGKNIVQSNPEKVFSHKEIIKLTIEEWGVETYLWLFGELSDLDYCKIVTKSPKDLKEIRGNYKKWYLKVTNDSFCK